MSDGDALLRGILRTPADDTARLVYADWLQENGGHAGEHRAQFIRDQVWLWANPSCRSCTGPEWGAGKPCAECREREERRGRTAVEMFGRERWLEWSRPANLCVPGGALWDDYVQFARGFVSEVSLPLAAFVQHAESLFAAHPIERVTIVDREPWENATNPPTHFGWWCENDLMNFDTENEVLPLPLMLCMDDDNRRRDRVIAARFDRERMHGVILFETRELARTALSDACVAYGRESAGLPALEVPRD